MWGLLYLHHIAHSVGQEVAECGHRMKVDDVGRVPVFLSLAGNVLQEVRHGQSADHQWQKAAVSRWTLQN